MQGCPLYFENSTRSKKPSIIEGFSSSNGDSQCLSSNGTDGKTASNDDWYESIRTKNIEQADDKYNNLLSQYLNDYNKYLVLKGLQENSNPSDTAQDFTTALSEAQTKYEQSKQELEDLADNIEKNNEESQTLIHNQTKDIENKTKTIQLKNNLITGQTKIIDDRNAIMNSRTRQIQLGVEKNLYKRNIMYFLIFINVIVVVILFIIIHKG